MHGEGLGIEPERLSNRLKFLIGRAEVHTEFKRQGYEHQAIAATAYRDAASIALLLEDADKARNLLQKAGTGFLELGLIHGAVLLELAGGPKAFSSLADYSDLIDGVRVQKRFDGEEERSARPLENSARTTTSQLFALYQVECLRDGLTTEGGSEAPFRQALDRRAGFQVGVTGLSIDSYMRMGQELINPLESKLELDRPFLLRSVEAIASTRFEAIQSAMRDSYHWQRILRPSALLDFDTLVLGSLALSSDFGLGPFDRLLSDEVPYLSAPIRAAKLLRQGPEQEPLSTY
ncbi:MAG: hypothetical protein CML03_06725 [Pseudooceanicola sp.]|nr:hypothetical protein [Pseudooceanicola sp.]